MGVEHFYLYNNLSADNYQEVLDSYIQEGIVELFELPVETTKLKFWSRLQNGTYDETIKKVVGITKWLAVMDTDEFLVPVVEENLLELLASYEDYGALVVHWQMYGTSGVKRIADNELMTEKLLLRAADDCFWHKYVKSIVRPERVASCNNPHVCTYKKGYYAVNETKTQVKNKYENDIPVDRIRINHYWARDEEFFYNIKLARVQKMYKTKNFEESIKKEAQFNEVFDETILRHTKSCQRKIKISPLSRRSNRNTSHTPLLRRGYVND